MDTAHDVVTELNSRFEMPDTEIAKRIGSSQPTVWRLRSGKTKDCSADLYRKLCLLRDEVAQKASAGTPAPAAPEAAPARALACASQSVRLTADRRQLNRRETPVAAAQPDQLPLLLDGGEPHQEAA